jgi:glycerol dehydrogenase
MSNASVFLPSYSIGDNVYAEVSAICRPYGKKIVLIGGKTALSKAKSLLLKAIDGAGFEIIDTLWYGDDATYENVAVLKEQPAVQEADMVFAVGGGRALDTCKTLCDEISKPIFTFPTIASNCAPVTAVCVMYDNQHVFKNLYFPKKPANHAFINTKIISEAPRQFLWAGIGDALSKQYESEFSSRGDEMDHTNALGVQIGRNCSEALLKYGEQALAAADRHETSTELEQVVLTIIVSTGLVSVLVTNNYNSCLAHSIYYGCTVLPQGEKHLHGELVSYGVLVLLTLDNQQETRDRVFEFNKQVGLPTCLADIEINSEELEKVLDKVMTTDDIVHVPYEITRTMIYQAIMELEEQNN